MSAEREHERRERVAMREKSNFIASKQVMVICT